MLRRVKASRKVCHELVQIEDNVTLPFPWEWADWDRHRLVFAEAGCIRAAHLGSHKLATIHTLYDFNRMTPDAPA